MNFHLTTPLNGVTSFQDRQVNTVTLTIQISLVNLLIRMESPQNCSYRKSTLVMLTLILWQITVKFNITPLIVIKLLPSSTLNLWQSLLSGFHIKAETSDAKFNITPLAFGSLLSFTLSYDDDLPLSFRIEAEMTNVKFNTTPMTLPYSQVQYYTYDTSIFSFPNKTKIPVGLS